MATKKRVHVIKRTDGWVLKKEGAERASRKFDTKEEAVDSAKNYRHKGHDIVVHKKDGTIERWSKS
ncbi:MAG: DUF2188 domain-containing protein [Saprospiraceae bacterium]